MVYSVSHYLKRLILAKRTARTITLYGDHLRHYAEFLGVPVGELQNHLTKENLINYAEKIQTLAPSTQQLTLSIVLRFYKVNGVTTFDEIDTAILKPRNYDEPDDKPLTHKMLVRMMDIANPRERAMITMLVSTGMRAGELCAICTGDIEGDIIHIRPEITHQRGRVVYLNAEAREALDVWLGLREAYKGYIDCKYYSRGREGEDNRVFCLSYNSIKRIWLKLYNRVDGEKGKYHAKCTTHSCRKYFRTNAVREMDLDLVEKIMGHEGYLTKAYVRIEDEDARRMFHEGEHALYITKRDERIGKTEIEILKKERGELAGTVTAMQNQIDELARATKAVMKAQKAKGK